MTELRLTTLIVNIKNSCDLICTGIISQLIQATNNIILIIIIILWGVGSVWLYQLFIQPWLFRIKILLLLLLYYSDFQSFNFCRESFSWRKERAGRRPGMWKLMRNLYCSNENLWLTIMHGSYCESLSWCSGVVFINIIFFINKNNIII